MISLVTVSVYVFYILHSVFAVRPAYENNEDLCPFINRHTINGIPAEMTPRITGMKYFRRVQESRERMSSDKVRTICRMYNLEAAEILDQDDYDEAITIVRESGWSFWIAVKGKYNTNVGNFHFDFTLADGFTKIGFHGLGPQSFSTEAKNFFEKFKEGCVVIGPSSSEISGVSWFKVPCTETHDILCQYKKSCYRRSDYLKDPTRPIKRLIPLIKNGEEESGYAISTIQATWPFAKQVCEDSGMSLVWFDDKKELDAFTIRITEFAKEKVHYIGKPLWTAGRFSPWNDTGDIYDKLYWWKHNSAIEVSGWELAAAHSGHPENSGGFLKTWGKDREVVHEGKNEPYDEGLQRKERCVDATFFEGVGEFFTSKCDKSLRHFVCKNSEVVRQTLIRPETPLPSHVEYCTGNKYYRTTEKDCNGEVIFAGQAKPDCTCYSGAHALMADMKCKPKLFVGSRCVKLKAKTTLHWKILPSHITHKKPWIIVAHTTDEKREMFNWFSANVEESAHRQILGAATFYFSGFDLYRDDSSAHSNDLCFVVNSKLAPTEFYEYSVNDLPSISMRYYNYPTADCRRKQVSPGGLIRHQVASSNECRLSSECLNNTESDSKATGRTVKIQTQSGGEPVFLDLSGKSNGEVAGRSGSTGGGCEEGDETCGENDIHQDAGLESPSNKKGKAEGDIEDANENVNRQLLIYAIEAAFPHFTSAADARTGPTNTWRILEKIFELAKQACIKMVRPDFLSRVLKYFRIAHFGENYDYGEYFSEVETRQALTMLDFCHERAISFSKMDVELDSCTGKTWRVTLENKTREVITRSMDDTGYQSVFHHHVMEATWDVIDLWNAMCLTEFKSSYLLFHHVERGLEILFNDKLRKLWHFPNVTEVYFQKLLGPDEGTQLLNLDQCVLAAYKGNVRINRMGRPNRGMNAVVGRMIRNRLDDENLKNRGIPPSRGGNEQSGNLTVACIRGPTVRCHRKITKNKKNRPNDALLALYRRYS